MGRQHATPGSLPPQRAHGALQHSATLPASTAVPCRAACELHSSLCELLSGVHFPVSPLPLLPVSPCSRRTGSCGWASCGACTSTSYV